MSSRRIANIKREFSTESGYIHQEVAEFVKDSMVQLGVGKKLGTRTVLLAEETTEQFFSMPLKAAAFRYG